MSESEMSQEELVRNYNEARVNELWRRAVELQLEVLDLRRRVSELEAKKEKEEDLRHGD